MSRNKTIVLLHETTLKPFKDCRAALKRNHWDFSRAYFELLGGLDWRDFGASLSEALNTFASSICDAAAALQNLAGTIGNSLLTANELREQFGLPPVVDEIGG